MRTFAALQDLASLLSNFAEENVADASRILAACLRISSDDVNRVFASYWMPRTRWRRQSLTSAPYSLPIGCLRWSCAESPGRFVDTFGRMKRFLALPFLLRNLHYQVFESPSDHDGLPDVRKLLGCRRSDVTWCNSDVVVALHICCNKEMRSPEFHRAICSKFCSAYNFFALVYSARNNIG